MFKKQILIAVAGAACMLTAGAARASDVYWSIGINAPPIGTVISNGPAYYGASPGVVYAAPPTVYLAPRPLYRPAPVVIRPWGFRQPGYEWDHDRGRGWDRHHDGRWRGGYRREGDRGHGDWHEGGRGDGRGDGRGWAPVPRGERRHHHDAR